MRRAQPRQCGHVDHEIGRLLIGVGQCVGQDEAAFRIGIVDLDSQALAALVNVAGSESVGGNRIFNNRYDDAQVDLEFCIHDHQRQTEDIGGTAHVLLHQKHRGGRLDVKAAGIEAHALADERDATMAFLPQRSSSNRGASALARPTTWTSGKFCVSRSSPVMTVH